MQHFGLEEWVDFARDLVDAKNKTAMQGHLESGCRDCAKTLQMWKRVHEITRRDSMYEPPEGSVRFVKGAYALNGPQKANRAKPTMAQLLFDSFANPLPAAVRSSGAAVRQLLYGTDMYQVDVRIEPMEDSERAFLTGQILASKEPNQNLDKVPVVAAKGREILAKSVTNPFGEFQMEGDLNSSLQLQFRLSNGTDLCIPLLEPTDKPSDSAAMGSSVNRAKRRRGKKLKSKYRPGR